MLSDPLKLIPLLVIAIAGAGLLMGRITTQDTLALLTVATGAHAAISAFNNVNPPKS